MLGLFFGKRNCKIAKQAIKIEKDEKFIRKKKPVKRKKKIFLTFLMAVGGFLLIVLGGGQLEKIAGYASLLVAALEVIGLIFERRISPKK